MPNTRHQPNHPHATDRLASRAWQCVLTYKLCILSTLLSGLAAHLFFLSHKLVTFDDPLFTYGHGYDSGRWGLDILRHLVSPFSMPWFNGMVSLTLLAVTMVVVVRLLGIRRPVLQALLPAVMATSALQVSIFLFMCASTPYALSLLLAVLSSWFVTRPGRYNFALASMLLMLSISLYQVYVTVAVALLLVMACLRLLDTRPLERATIRHWIVRVVAYLSIAVAVYFVIALTLIQLKGGLQVASNYDYAMSTGFSVPLIEHFTGVYTKFVDMFIQGRTGIISTPLSVVLHTVLLLAVIGTVLHRQWQQEGNWRLAAQAAILLVALPATINLFWLLLAPAHWNTLTVYAFMAVYALATAVADRCVSRQWLTDTVAVCLAGIVACNIYFANRTYLQVHIYNTNNTAFYTGVITQVKLMPELQPGTQLALVGLAQQFVYNPDRSISYNGIRGQGPITNVYSRREFIIHHLGFDIPILNSYDPLQQQLEADPRVKAMPAYPASGSIQAFDNIIVVKLGNLPS